MPSSKVFLYGLDYAGKTALLLTMKHNQPQSITKPTLSFNLDTITFQDISFQIWDAPGQAPLRKIWGKGIERAKILIFVLDTNDKERFNEAYIEFIKILEDPLTRGLPLIFCYHKMDLEGSKTNLQNAKTLFKLSKIISHKVFVYETSIMDLNSLRKLKNTLIDIVMGVMY